MAKTEARSARLRQRIDWWQGGLTAALLALLAYFILYPVLRVLWASLSDEQGRLTLIHFANFFRRPLFREALWNSLLSGLLVVFFGSLIAVPLAYFSSRFEFRGKILFQTLGTLPLVIPPFVGAVALQLILGRSGMVNLLLMRWFVTTYVASRHKAQRLILFLQSRFAFTLHALDSLARHRRQSA